MHQEKHIQAFKRLGENIKRLREKRGVTAKELSEAVHMPLKTLLDVESGKVTRVFNARHLIGVCVFFSR